LVAEALEDLASHYPPNSQKAINLRSAVHLRRTVPSTRIITVSPAKDADAYLSRAPCNHVGDHAIETYHREKSRERAEDCGEAGEQPLGAQRKADLLLHSLQSHDGHIRIELAHAFAKLVRNLTRLRV
jgi:hypothetical protein